MEHRSSLWTALGSAIHEDPEAWVAAQRANGATWRDIAASCADVGVPVSYEFLRMQAKYRGIDDRLGDGEVA
jgi:hypothetical protein